MTELATGGAPSERSRSHEAILRRIEAQLASGELAAGDRLPAERTLAEQVGVSRASVREALRVLEALGVLEVTGGQGRDSGAVVVARPGWAIGTAMRMHVATRGLPIADLVETRVLLETASMRRLGRRVTAGPDGALLLAPAEAILTRMKDGALTPEEFHRLDSGFHVALTEAAGNIVVAVIMASLREAIEAYVLPAVPALPDWAATAGTLRRQHAALLTALRQGEGERAAEIVERHIRRFFSQAFSQAFSEAVEAPEGGVGSPEGGRPPGVQGM